jgi:pyruvate,water dikinase
MYYVDSDVVNGQIKADEEDDMFLHATGNLRKSISREERERFVRHKLRRYAEFLLDDDAVDYPNEMLNGNVVKFGLPSSSVEIIDLMEHHGLSRKKDPSLHIYVMCEIPSNVILADRFLDLFDGMSIGSNDLTQLTLGIDRDGNEKIRSIANENDESVKELIRMVIKKCHSRNKYIGICGQAPSDYPDFAAFLVKEGIESISLNPDTVVKTLLRISKEEQK